MRPVDAKWEVSQPFGGGATQGVGPGDPMWPYVQMYGNYQPYGHAGEDIACPIGTPVYAAAPGTVLWADWGTNLPGDDSEWGYRQRWYLYKGFPGIVTVIQHPGWIGVYAHLSSNDAAPAGTVVKAGQLIGLSGNTGGVAPHLHREALVDLDFTTGGGLIYGRTDPSKYDTIYTAQSNATAPAKGFLMALTDKQQTDLYNRIIRYVDSPVSAVPKKVWGIPVLRGGKKVSALQELADAKTLIGKQQATIDALTAKVNALTGPGAVK